MNLCWNLQTSERVFYQQDGGSQDGGRTGVVSMVRRRIYGVGLRSAILRLRHAETRGSLG